MTYTEKYQLWLDEVSLTKSEKAALEAMDEKTREDAFYQDISFGTGGIRGLMGLGTNRVNIYTIRKATLGLGQYLISKKLKNGVAISYDNRQDSKKFAHEAAAVLAALGIKSYIYRDLRPTPMLSYAVRYFKASAGIMITASHNPKEYNGFKVYNQTGAQINTEEAQQIISQINQIASPFNIQTSVDHHIEEINQEVEDAYLKEVKTIGINTGLKKQIKIVYTPLHGNGGPVIPPLLASKGYDVHPVAAQMVPDPAFGATKSSNPEEAIAFELALSEAKAVDADIVLATDPDTDRLGIAVKHQGKYVLLNGNQTAALTLYYLLTEKSYDKKGFVYTTVVTSDLVKEIALYYNHYVGQTLTGFKFIGEQAHLIEGKYDYIFGCEESYGSLIKDFVRDKDAVQACYMLAEMANSLSHRGFTLIDYLDQIYDQFGTYEEYTHNITLKGRVGAEKIQAIMKYFRTHGLNLANFKPTIVEDYIKGFKKEHDIILPPSNVLKYADEDTWIVFRPSGTEPKLKIYFSTKQSTSEQAKEEISQLLNEVLDVLETNI